MSFSTLSTGAGFLLTLVLHATMPPYLSPLIDHTALCGLFLSLRYSINTELRDQGRKRGNMNKDNHATKYQYTR